MSESGSRTKDPLQKPHDWLMSTRMPEELTSNYPRCNSDTLTHTPDQTCLNSWVSTSSHKHPLPTQAQTAVTHPHTATTIYTQIIDANSDVTSQFLFLSSANDNQRERGREGKKRGGRREESSDSYTGEREREREEKHAFTDRMYTGDNMKIDSLNQRQVGSAHAQPRSPSPPARRGRHVIRGAGWVFKAAAARQQQWERAQRDRERQTQHPETALRDRHSTQRLHRTKMLRAPPFLLILSLNLLHSIFLHAVPLGEEQIHQMTHQNSANDPVYSSKLEVHQEAPLSHNQLEKREDASDISTTQVQSQSASDDGDELFKDISPKALAAVLLQALNEGGEEQDSSTLEDRKPSENEKPIKEEGADEEMTESIRSKTQSPENEDVKSEDEHLGNGEDMESVKSLLQELESFEPPPKREQEPSQDTISDNEDLEELRELLGLDESKEEEKRNSQKPLPHTPRMWEEDKEGEKLAGVAQDLLLQYILNGGENEGEQQEEEGEEKEEEQDEDYQGGDFIGGQRPLFEDEEGENIQDKRSTEDDIDEVDPQTIDNLIELSTRLHLPADDVVDIINDVERRKRRKMKKKKARDYLPRRKDRTRTPPQSWPDTPKPVYYPRRRLDQQPMWNKVSEPVWKVPDYNWKKMQQASWKKVYEPSWNRAKSPSWKKVPQQSWNNLPDSNWNKVPDSNWNKISDSNWNKASDSSWNKASDSNWNKVPDSNWNKGSDSNWNKVSDSNWNKVPDSNWNKVPDSNWNKVSDSNWNKVSDSNWNKVPDSKWNKVQESKWNKMQEPSWNKMQDSDWNSIMNPVPRRYRTRPSSFNNYIRPRAFQYPPRYYYKPPIPRRDDYYDDDQDKQEEMENYIERILLTHPEVFQ
ncbi:Hypothetical predicted protein [Pelobates cultripes]|uniref:Uncharacterized protein n=1 Tax=Pelobates cultripes TaxID=61616 RepID=A0AAD1RJ38_PELCU|nr:Hypothetical predicted protein [Pelobates cultripes]